MIGLQSFIGEFDLLFGEPGRLQLLRNQIAPGDLLFLLLAVAGEPQDFHAIQQRLRNGIERIRRCDEQHLRQIERQVQIVIAERLVLLRIEHLEQCRGRIATEIAAQLVHFVEQQHRIHARPRAAWPAEAVPAIAPI